MVKMTDNGDISNEIGHVHEIDQKPLQINR